MHSASAPAAGTNNKGAVTMPAQPGLALTHGMQVPHCHWSVQGRWRFIKATCMSGEAGARPRTARSLARSLAPTPLGQPGADVALLFCILPSCAPCFWGLPGRPRAFLRSTTVCWDCPDCPGQRARWWCGHATEHSRHSSRGCSFNCACRPRPPHPYAGARWHRQVSTTMRGLSIVDCDARLRPAWSRQTARILQYRVWKRVFGARTGFAHPALAQPHARRPVWPRAVSGA